MLGLREDFQFVFRVENTRLPKWKAYKFQNKLFTFPRISYYLSDLLFLLFFLRCFFSLSKNAPYDSPIPPLETCWKLKYVWLKIWKADSKQTDKHVFPDKIRECGHKIQNSVVPPPPPHGTRGGPGAGLMQSKTGPRWYKPIRSQHQVGLSQSKAIAYIGDRPIIIKDQVGISQSEVRTRCW